MTNVYNSPNLSGDNMTRCPNWSCASDVAAYLPTYLVVQQWITVKNTFLKTSGKLGRLWLSPVIKMYLIVKLFEVIFFAYKKSRSCMHIVGGSQLGSKRFLLFLLLFLLLLLRSSQRFWQFERGKSRTSVFYIATSWFIFQANQQQLPNSLFPKWHLSTEHWTLDLSRPIN